VYLVSDRANLKGSLNGYYVRIGENGTADGVDLFRQQGNTHTKLIDGAAGRAATNPRLRVKVIRDAAGNWQLYSDNTGGTLFVAEGSATDNTFTTTAFFGVYCTFPATRRKSFFFDDFIIRDAPVSLVGATATGPTALRVTFSTAVEESAATGAAGYTLDNGAVVQSAAVDPADPTRVLLQLAEPLATAGYTLTVSGIRDRNGNPLPAGSTAAFSYTAPVGYRQLVINELLADESPRVDLPLAEFVELHNPTSRSVNLKGCTLADPGTTVALPDYVLPPGGYVILCKSTFASEFEAYGPVIGLGTWPSLNNTGDGLLLKNHAGQLIDRVTYTDKWYQDDRKAEGGWTLEQVNPLTGCSNFTNWRASTNAAGGTPGKVNSIFSDAPDATPPGITRVQVIDNQTLELQFSEPMDSVALMKGTYRLADETPVRVQPAGGEHTAVRLAFGTPLTPGTKYLLSVDGLTDCAGNSLPKTTLKTGIGLGPQYHQLLFTEILADEEPAVGLPKAEFVELYNPTNTLLSLAGVTFADGTSTAKLPDETIFPGEYLILCASAGAELYRPYGRVISLAGFSLNNTGEPLLLRNAAGQTVCWVEYRTGWYGDGRKADGGWSLEMIDARNPCAGTGNWTASVHPAGGTPGGANSVASSRPDLTPPQGMAVEVTDARHLRVRFTEPLDSLAMTQPGLYQLSGGAAVARAVPAGPQYESVQLTLAADLAPRTGYTLTLGNARDCAGNIHGGVLTASFALPEPGDSGDVVLNEVLFNPRSGGVDFVEMYNRSDKYVNLQGWQLATTEAGQPANGKNISTAYRVLPPRHYAVLTTDGRILKDQYPRAKDSTLIQLPALPSYPDEAGSVVLRNDLGQLVDQFDYSDSFHFALVDRQEGVSLERISTAAPGNTRQNWHSAAGTEGYATPGYRNSQWLEGQPAADAFQLQPSVFTPDEDGLDDFTTLQYHFPGQGNVATVTIFDAAGREVKKWVRNELLGTAGFYTWDGTDDRGAKVRTGGRKLDRDGTFYAPTVVSGVRPG
ncbi:MAG: lamin tail domain-containing protein, partial [Cytophagales bacterium]|nr:lamin tail domain-containing protein [Cytophagales bacterium]